MFYDPEREREHCIFAWRKTFSLITWSITWVVFRIRLNHRSWIISSRLDIVPLNDHVSPECVDAGSTTLLKCGSLVNNIVENWINASMLEGHACNPICLIY